MYAMKALIVEDNMKLARYIENGLCRGGFTCAIAAEGQTALGMLAGKAYDIVIQRGQKGRSLLIQLY